MILIKKKVDFSQNFQNNLMHSRNLDKFEKSKFKVKMSLVNL